MGLRKGTNYDHKTTLGANVNGVVARVRATPWVAIFVVYVVRKGEEVKRKIIINK